MWRPMTAIAAAFLAASCSVPFTQIAGADGKPEYVMKCNGLMSDMQGCQRLARELCPRGYRLVNTNSPYGVVQRQTSVPTDSAGNVHIACTGPRVR